jgi:uncharacterized protein
MIRIGEFNLLKVVRQADFGYYLDAGTGSTSDDILLPNKNALEREINIDDSVNAFIYRDSSDRIIATLKDPLAKVNELAYLKVVSNTEIGSFIDMGLERDIFVPFKEKKYELFVDKSYLFYIYLDKTSRIAATTNISSHLETTDTDTDTDTYKTGDEVKGTVYNFQTNGSIEVAIENKYLGVVLFNEYFSDVTYGDILNLRILKCYEDGRLEATPRKYPKDERLGLEETILSYLKEHDGFMPFNDKSSPLDIKNTFHESKNYFKNALGGLMKQRLITQDENGTKLVK